MTYECQGKGQMIAHPNPYLALGKSADSDSLKRMTD